MGWQHQYHWQWAYCKLFQMWICQPATSNMKLFVTIVIGFIISKTKTLFFQYSGFLDRHGLRFHVVFFNWTWDLVKNLDLSSRKSWPAIIEISTCHHQNLDLFIAKFSTCHQQNLNRSRYCSRLFILKSQPFIVYLDRA